MLNYGMIRQRLPLDLEFSLKPHYQAAPSSGPIK
jgi:hypothetical protein